MNMIRIPNLSGTFDNGPNVSGEYENIKVVNLPGKSFQKQFTFPASDTGNITPKIFSWYILPHCLHCRRPPSYNGLHFTFFRLILSCHDWSQSWTAGITRSEAWHCSMVVTSPTVQLANSIGIP